MQTTKIRRTLRDIDRQRIAAQVGQEATPAVDNNGIKRRTLNTSEERQWEWYLMVASALRFIRRRTLVGASVPVDGYLRAEGWTRRQIRETLAQMYALGWIDRPKFGGRLYVVERKLPAFLLDVPRVGGNAVCPECQKTWLQHPHDSRFPEDPGVIRRCDGSAAKI